MSLTYRFLAEASKEPYSDVRQKRILFARIDGTPTFFHI